MRILHSRSAAWGFTYRLDDEWRKDWSPTDLRGKKSKLEDDCDGCTDGLDTADLVVLLTHSTYEPYNTVRWAMPDFGRYAETKNMELGEEGDGLRALISYSCYTIRPYQGYQDHWRPVFNGGLVVFLGSIGCMQFDNSSYYKMEAVADYMLGSNSMWYSWYSQMFDSDNPRLGVLATSTAPGASCDSRTTVHLDDLTSTNRLREGDYSTWCRRWFD